MSQEDSRQIKGYPGYWIHKDGWVYSEHKGGFISQRWVSGYLAVTLWRKGQQNTKYVHRLVLEAFVGPCPPGMEACHNNSNPADNRLSNLRWDTRQANHKDKPNLTSKYYGVCWKKRPRIWEANIQVNGKQIHLGSFDSEIEAAKAYDAYVISNNLNRPLNFSY